jgi:hypothetical protein
MDTEMGEYIVGAHLRLVLECDVVDFVFKAQAGRDR